MKNVSLKLTLILLCLCLVLGGCSNNPTGPSQNPTDNTGDGDGLKSGIDFEVLADEVIIAETDVTFTDARGETVTLQKHPGRVISIINSYTTLWYQAGGSIIGRLENESELPPEALDPAVQIVGATTSSVSMEALLTLEPDLVILRLSSGSNYIPQLEQNGVPVLAMEYNGFADYLKWLKIFTALNGTEELYTAQGTDLLTEIDDIIAQIPDMDNPTVMFMFGTTSSVKAYLSNTAVGEMIKQMKAINIADSWEDTTATSVEMNTEYLITADPDYILVQCMGDPAKIEEYINDVYGGEGWWKALSAVQNGRVVYLDRGLFHFKANNRYAEAYHELGKILYPDVFA